MKAWTLRGIAAVAGLLVSQSAVAEPPYAQYYRQKYGYVPSCNACHTAGGGSKLNPFGEAFNKAGHNPNSWAAIEALDSDGDGAKNAEEAAAKANPGFPDSTPAKPGPWLDTANLIPKEVQEVFPGVTAFKPIDAILTEAEFTRAKALGVTLTKDDETTIYVPVKDGKAAGTSILVPQSFKDKRFFVLVATDPSLTITSAKAIHAEHTPGAAESPKLSNALKKSLKEVESASGEGLDDAVQNGIKKASTILWVRLKKE